MADRCDHYVQANDQITPNTKECEECEKEKTPWVALRMCLTCGHVGCCDSSVGLHATKHFKDTGHPVMDAVPEKSGHGVIFIKNTVDVLWCNTNWENGILTNLSKTQPD